MFLRGIRDMLSEDSFLYHHKRLQQTLHAQIPSECDLKTFLFNIRAQCAIRDVTLMAESPPTGMDISMGLKIMDNVVPLMAEQVAIALVR